MKPAVFTVSCKGMLIRVRLLASYKDVHREYVASGSPRVGRDEVVCACFDRCSRPTAKHFGTIRLPRDGALYELVPHEVFHAVTAKLGTLTEENDEQAATAAGLLSARIFKQLIKMGVVL